MEENQENALIRAAQQHDQASAEALLKQYMPMIHKLAARFHTVSFVREELIQAGCEGFIKAVSKYSFGEHAKLITYAFPWILGEMKRSLSAVESGRMTVSYENLESCGLTISAGEDLRLDGLRIDLKTAFDRLNPEDRRLLHLRYYRDMTQHETAERLRKSQSQISKSERRILCWLRAQLS